MSQATYVHPSIYLIADHLDAVLAHGAGEDLLGLSPPAEPDAEDGRDAQVMQQRLALQRDYLEEVRAIEQRLIHRVLRAREHAEQVRRTDGRFKIITDLFVGGTHVVADAAAEIADSTALDFNTGRGSAAYLKSRGLSDDSTVVMPGKLDLKITESFKLAGAIELGAMLDLAAAYIDTLELHYELYGEDGPTERAQPQEPRAGAAP